MGWHHSSAVHSLTQPGAMSSARGHLGCRDVFGISECILMIFRVVEHILMIFRVEHPRAGCAGLSKLLCGVFRGAGPRPGGVPSGPTRAEPGRAVHCHDNPAQK